MAELPPAAQKGHTRNTSSADERRVAVPRRRTKGPLDFEQTPPFRPAPDNPLAASASPAPAPTPPPPPPPPPAASPTSPTSTPDPLSRDFTYLRYPQNFHPLPSHTLPPSFRALQPPPTTPLSTLLTTAHFRSAAITAANTLTSPSPLSPAEIFRLWYVRLASLTLINATPTAAQEIKVLSDLSSAFYRDGGASLLPWELRVLAVRLQAIGFEDWRRSVGMYYELAREARAEILRSEPTAGAEHRALWRKRLRELGVRVGSALVEMGDLKAAGRHLEGLRRGGGQGEGEGEGEGGEDDAVIMSMLCLLYIKVGNLPAARQCLPRGGADEAVLQALFHMSEARWTDAVAAWTRIAADEEEVVVKERAEMAKSNLAVCLLYTGKLEESRAILETLIDTPTAFPGLTFNLSTIYELCSDNSKALKMALAERVAATRGGEMVNSSFKM